MNMQLNFKKMLLLVIFLYLPISHSAEFCATTSGELFVALLTADSNGQADHIKVAEGSYIAPLGGFPYVTAENSDLEISGGWSTFFGNPCGQNLGGAFNTVLNGNSSQRVMRIQPGQFADIDISGLNFVNGFATDPGELGAGLLVNMGSNSTGKVTVENSSFINNHGFGAGALRITGGERVTIRNSLFVINTADSGSVTVNVAQTDGTGVYISNNTIVDNTGGLYVYVQGTSQAMVANNVLWGNDAPDMTFQGNGFSYLWNNNIEVQAGVPADNTSNNISMPPMFEAGLLNYTPSFFSPLVNQGYKPPTIVPIPVPFNVNWSLGLTDLDGNTRIQVGKVDIGAIESPYDFSELPIFRNGFEALK